MSDSKYLRAIAERSEHGLTNPLALAALDKAIAEAIEAHYRQWQREYGGNEAKRLWRRHFGAKMLPDDE